MIAGSSSADLYRNAVFSNSGLANAAGSPIQRNRPCHWRFALVTRLKIMLGTEEQPLQPRRSLPDLMAEVVHAVRREQARTVGDVLLRRTRLGLTAARPLLASGAVSFRTASLGTQVRAWVLGYVS